MTIAITYIWPGQDLGGRSTKGLTTNSQLFFPVWDRHLTWTVPFSSNIPVSFSMGINDDAAFFQQASQLGYVDFAVDNVSNLWCLSGDGRLAFRTIGGVNTVAASCVPAGQIPCKIAIDTTGLLILCASGNVYHITSITASPTEIGTFGAFASNFSYYSGNIYATLAGSQTLAIMTNPGGSVTTVSTPMVFPAFVNATSHGIAVAGFTPANLTYDYLSMQSSPAASSTIAAGILSGASTLQVISGTDLTWAVSSSTATSHVPVDFAWVPNGEQVLVSEASNTVEVFNDTSGSFASAQTLTVPNAGALAITTDSTNALVCQEPNNGLLVLINTLGTWATGTSVSSVTAPTDVVLTSSSAAYVAGSGGISILSRLGNVWSVSSTVALSGFAPSQLAYDSISGNVYAIGSSGGDGFLAYLDSTNTAHAATSWTGSADDILVFSNRVLVLDKTNNAVRVFPSGSVNYSGEEKSQTAYLTSATGIFNLNNTIFIANASEAVGLQFTAGPLVLGLLRNSVISVYNGSSFDTYDGPTTEDIPTAIQWSTAGNLFVATSQNNFLQLTAAASLTSTTSLGEYAEQAENTPLGISSLTENGTSWYCTTSLSGVIILITGVSG